METYYSKPVQMPKTKQHGLQNFVQLIINDIEAGETQEALYKAVDLLDALQGTKPAYEVK